MGNPIIAHQYIEDRKLLKYKKLDNALKVVNSDPKLKDDEKLKEAIIEILISELGSFFTKLLRKIFG